jgi:hypothetical protein
MAEFRRTLLVDRPPAEIYTFLADFRNSPEWAPIIAEAAPLQEGTPATGHRWQLRMMSQQRESHLTLELTELSADRMTFVARTLVYRLQLRFEVQSLGSSSTVVFEAAVSLRGFGALLDPFVQDRLDAVGTECCEGLRNVLAGLS